MNIGLIGKFGSGKTTLANYIINKYGFERIAFADPIKQILKEYFNVTDKKDPKYRVLIQKIGTDWFRSEDPDVWINCLIKNSKNYNINWVCDDVRFINEAEKLLENNWKLIYLQCDDVIRIERCIARDGVFDYNTLKHSSELEVDKTVEKFKDKISIINSNLTLDIIYTQLDSLLSIKIK